MIHPITLRSIYKKELDAYISYLEYIHRVYYKTVFDVQMDHEHYVWEQGLLTKFYKYDLSGSFSSIISSLFAKSKILKCQSPRASYLSSCGHLSIKHDNIVSYKIPNYKISNPIQQFVEHIPFTLARIAYKKRITSDNISQVLNAHFSLADVYDNTRTNIISHIFKTGLSEYSVVNGYLYWHDVDISVDRVIWLINTHNLITEYRPKKHTDILTILNIDAHKNHIVVYTPCKIW